MTVEEFARLVPGLSGMSHVERVHHFAWFLHVHGGRERFGTADLQGCYDRLHYPRPGNLGSQLQKLADKRPAELLKDAKGWRLSGHLRERLDGKYAARPAVVAVDSLLKSLPGKVSDEAERLFLSEAITCYRSQAFRAAIVMTWNLAYDHLVAWVVANHLAAFNAALPKRLPKRSGPPLASREDFAELKEFDVIEVCGTAAVISSSLKKILNEKLTKRNTAAHPSLVDIGPHQAEDVITDLVNNVILKLQ